MRTRLRWGKRHKASYTDTAHSQLGTKYLNLLAAHQIMSRMIGRCQLRDWLCELGLVLVIKSKGTLAFVCHLAMLEPAPLAFDVQH